MKTKDDLSKGIIYALIAAFISGIAIFYSKIALAKISPIILTTSRNMTAALLLVVCYWLLGRKEELKNLKKKDLLKLLLIGIIGGALPFYLFFTGLQFVQPAVANLIHKTLFIWVTFLAVIFLKEKLNLSYVIAFILIFLSNFYFAKIPLSFGKGEMMILTATIFWSVENILAKKVLKNISSELVGLFRMGIGSLLLFLSTVISGKAQLFLTYDFQKLTVVFIGGTILFFYVYFWYKALKYAPVSVATLILTFSVVVGTILNGVFAGVKILPRDIYSSLLITLASFFLFFQVIHQSASNLLSWVRREAIKKIKNE